MKFFILVLKTSWFLVSLPMLISCTKEKNASTGGGLPAAFSPQLLLVVNANHRPQHIVVTVDGATSYEPLLLNETPIASCGLDPALSKHEVAIHDHRSLRDLAYKKPSDTQASGGQEKQAYDPDIIIQNTEAARQLPVLASFSFDGSCDHFQVKISYTNNADNTLTVTPIIEARGH